MIVMTEISPAEKTEQPNKVSRLRMAGLITGILGASLDTFILWSFGNFGIIGAIIPGLIFAGALVLAWRKPLIGGIILIVLSFPTILPFGVPLMVSGILFVVAGNRKSAKNI
jgi:hypothetical protein